jgi:hypothetical protein
MDIICGKTGKHFNDVALLTECQKHCDRCSLNSIPEGKKPKIQKPDIFANVIWLDKDNLPQ